MSGTTVERGHSRSRSPDRSWRHRGWDRYNDHEWHDEDRVYRHIPRSRDVDVGPLNAKALLSQPKDGPFRFREEVERSEDSERDVRHRSSSLRPGIGERYRVSFFRSPFQVTLLTSRGIQGGPSPATDARQAQTQPQPQPGVRDCTPCPSAPQIRF